MNDVYRLNLIDTMITELQYILSQLTEIDRPRVAIFSHHHSDPDAIAAAYAFGELLRHFSSQLEYYIYADKLNTTAKAVADRFAIPILDTVVSLGDFIFVVDTTNTSKLGKFQQLVQQSSQPLVVIDHHAPEDLHKLAQHKLTDSAMPSTAMIICKFYEMLNIVPCDSVATALLAGHIYDSRRYLYGTTTQVLQSTIYLLNAHGDYAEANKLLQVAKPRGEIIAKLKAFSRLQYYSMKNLLLVTSAVKSYEASAARAFIEIGADVALVVSAQANFTRASARKKQVVAVNLAAIMSQLGSEFGGYGGGHADAAGLTLSTRLSPNMQQTLIKRFCEIIESEFT